MTVTVWPKSAQGMGTTDFAVGCMSRYLLPPCAGLLAPVPDRQIANTENICRLAVALKDEGFHGALLSIRPDIPRCRPTALMPLARILSLKILTTSHIATPSAS